MVDFFRAFLKLLALVQKIIFGDQSANTEEERGLVDELMNNEAFRRQEYPFDQLNDMPEGEPPVEQAQEAVELAGEQAEAAAEPAVEQTQAAAEPTVKQAEEDVEQAQEVYRDRQKQYASAINERKEV